MRLERHFREKIFPFDELRRWRQAQGSERRIVVTNGCFDILHRGHIELLYKARRLGDVLIVGVNSDASVRQLKGPTRPLNGQDDRVCLVAALESVAIATIFEDVRATELLTVLEPHVWVKGGDYTLETLDQDEVRAVHSRNGQIEIIPTIAGYSTTGLLERGQER